MRLLPADQWHEDLGGSVFVSFSREDDGTIIGEPPEFLLGPLLLGG